MVYSASGRPQKYTGFHEGNAPTSDDHCERVGGFLDDLHQSHDEFAVPQAEQAEIKAIVARTRADIVV
jgi:hypothetical protein